MLRNCGAEIRLVDNTIDLRVHRRESGFFLDRRVQCPAWQATLRQH
jgi:hypothetical protein